MTEEALIDEIRDYVHNIHTAEPFHGFSFRELREVGEHFALPREKRIEDFEKENAKLKTDYKVLSCSVGDFDELQNRLEEEQRKNNGLSDNLTKAKDLIELLLSDNRIMKAQFESEEQANIWFEHIRQAEQFLNDEGCPNCLCEDCTKNCGIKKLGLVEVKK